MDGALASLPAAPALPKYLERPRLDGETFGTLKRVEINGVHYWLIEAQPPVVIAAKRLFPGSEGLAPGLARFPVSRRAFGDLVWLLHRWPLTIENPAAFDRAYDEAVAHEVKRQELLRAPQRSVPPPVFAGTLKPFQEEGLAWALAHRRTLIADEMGLGKTVQAIAFLAAAGAWPALVIVPPHLVRHWQEKLTQFLRMGSTDAPLLAGRALKVNMIRGLRPRALPQAEIHVIHYLLLDAWRAELRAQGFGTIVFDEIQELRHAKTAKYSAASDICDPAVNVIGLSGTPIYNKGAEIWNVLNIIDYHCLGDWGFFTREWCDIYGGEAVKDPALLGAHLKREGLMIRRRKEDVLTDLPPKRRVVEKIDADGGAFAELIREAVRLARQASETEDNFDRGRLEMESINAARQATGIAKAPAVIGFLRGLMEAEEPTLCFLHHHAVADALVAAMGEHKPVMISGRQTLDEKWQAKEAFARGDTNLCLISLRAAAGIDGLQARARCVVFAELDWSPAVHSQAEDRAHRDGQRDSVLCYYLVCDDGTDPEMQEALGLKVSQFIGLMGDRAESEDDKALADSATRDHMRRLLARLRQRGGRGG